VFLFSRLLVELFF